MKLVHASSKQKTSKKNSKKFLATWLVFSVLFAGLGYFVLTYSQLRQGDLNQDGVVDSKDAALLLQKGSLNKSDLNGDGLVNEKDADILTHDRTDKTVLERESIKAETSGPVKIVPKPTRYLQ